MKCLATRQWEKYMLDIILRHFLRIEMSFCVGRHTFGSAYETAV